MTLWLCPSITSDSLESLWEYSIMKWWFLWALCCLPRTSPNFCPCFSYPKLLLIVDLLCLCTDKEERGFCWFPVLRRLTGRGYLGPLSLESLLIILSGLLEWRRQQMTDIFLLLRNTRPGTDTVVDAFVGESRDKAKHVIGVKCMGYKKK